MQDHVNDGPQKLQTHLNIYIDLNVSFCLCVVAVAQLVSCVHSGAGRFVQIDAMNDSRVGVADDAKWQQVLHTDQEQSVDVA